MMITDIGVYKGKTYFIETDHDRKIFVHESIVGKYELRKNMEIPESALEEIEKANSFRKVRERALYLIDSKEYGYVEMFRKLSQSYDEDVCYEVCNSLAKDGIINDRRYARMLAEHYMCRKYFGYYRAKQEMARRGITGEIAENALEELSDGTMERLEELVELKYERYLGDEKGLNKVRNALVRMGYSYSQIRDVLDSYNCDEE